MRPPVVLITTNPARGVAEMRVALAAMAMQGRGWSVDVISLLPPSAFGRELETLFGPLAEGTG